MHFSLLSFFACQVQLSLQHAALLGSPKLACPHAPLLVSCTISSGQNKLWIADLDPLLPVMQCTPAKYHACYALHQLPVFYKTTLIAAEHGTH